MAPKYEYLPAEPLKRALRWALKSRGLTWDELADQLGVTSRTLLRTMQASSIGVNPADRIAIRLGTHPALIWPREWCVTSQKPCEKRKEVQVHGQAAPHCRRAAAS